MPQEATPNDSDQTDDAQASPVDPADIEVGTDQLTTRPHTTRTVDDAAAGEGPSAN